jgi:hypothetical protein
MPTVDPSQSHSRHLESDEPLLDGVSVRRIAEAIRSLDSRLIGIEPGGSAVAPLLVYTFAVAGKTQAFRLPIGAETVDSIADLYPEAAAREQELQRQIGVTFAPRST